MKFCYFDSNDSRKVANEKGCCSCVYYFVFFRPFCNRAGDFAVSVFSRGVDLVGIVPLQGVFAGSRFAILALFQSESFCLNKVLL